MELTTERLDTIIECAAYHERAPEFGTRAWVAQGKYLDVTYWDEGNSWCEIVQVVPKKGYESEVIRFFAEVQEHPGE